MGLVKLATYRENCYFYFMDYGTDNRIKVDKYQSGAGLSFYFEDSDMRFAIGPEDIYYDRANNISFDLGDSHYIIDDGYRNLLIRTGYVMKLDENGRTYDGQDHTDKNDPKITNIKKEITHDLRNALWRMGSKFNFDSDPRTAPRLVTFSLDGYRFCFRTAKIEKHVSINESRKKEKLPYFPYRKYVDKNCNLSFALYCQKLDDNKKDPTLGDIKYTISDNLINEIREELGDEYKVECLPIKKRIIFDKLCI